MTAENFIQHLAALRSENEPDKVAKFFKGADGVTRPFGVRFGDVFDTAKTFAAMPLEEVNRLLDSDYYELRMGAVSIMDFQARSKKTSPERRKELFDLYLRRHDRLNNWDFVDRGAPSIVGDYLLDKDRAVLYQLAESKVPWERRTAMVATYAFIKKNQLEDTFRIAEILANDPHELVNKAVGGWIREAGKQDEPRLRAFLDEFAAILPRVTLRYAVEKLDKLSREHYLGLAKQGN